MSKRKIPHSLYFKTHKQLPIYTCLWQFSCITISNLELISFYTVDKACYRFRCEEILMSLFFILGCLLKYLVLYRIQLRKYFSHTFFFFFPIKNSPVCLTWFSNWLWLKIFATVLRQGSCIHRDLGAVPGKRTVAQDWKWEPSAPNPVLHRSVWATCLPLSFHMVQNNPKKLLVFLSAKATNTEKKKKSFPLHKSWHIFMFPKHKTTLNSVGEQAGKREVLH